MNDRKDLLDRIAAAERAAEKTPYGSRARAFAAEAVTSLKRQLAKMDDKA